MKKKRYDAASLLRELKIDVSLLGASNLALHGCLMRIANGFAVVINYILEKKEKGGFHNIAVENIKVGLTKVCAYAMGVDAKREFSESELDDIERLLQDTEHFFFGVSGLEGFSEDIKALNAEVLRLKLRNQHQPSGEKTEKPKESKSGHSRL